MHKVSIAQEEPRHNIDFELYLNKLRICWMLDRLAPYKLPRALDSLLLYQQPSSTTLYYSYLGMLALADVRLRNETGEITYVSTAFVNHRVLLFTHRKAFMGADSSQTTED